MASNDEHDSAHSVAEFQDFDDEEVFMRAEDHVLDVESKNFVVEFGKDKARIAFDIGINEAKKILDQDHSDPNYPIRWINIWDPSRQIDVMTAIAGKYGFSTRLLNLMIMPKPQQDEIQPHKGRKNPFRHNRSPKDLEKGDSMNGSHLMKDPTMAESDEAALYSRVKDTVNYFSTDQTQKAFCIGANWLHKRPALTSEREHSRISIMPPKHWQWLALCNNHTVLSIHERHTFETVPEKENENSWHDAEFRYMRAHTLNVLLQQSTRGFDLYKTNPLAQSSVRESLQKPKLPDMSREPSAVSVFSNSEIGSLADEGTSNLFYYLFEDYVAAGPLKAAEEELNELTQKVLEGTHRKKVSKSFEIIPTLHYLSKDLREFKHLFENYKNLIDKIEKAARPEPHVGIKPSADRQVFLTYSALSRFDRLRDRLQYLMLNTIEGYVEEIAALSTTYFNLTQQKDSQATARLTRSATLLAKLTVFFLPISFMTSYFSVQIEDLYVYWTGQMYWYAFAVIASVSFVSLFFFSRLLMFFIDVMDEWAVIIANWGGIFLQTIRGWTGFKSKKRDGDKQE